MTIGTHRSVFRIITPHTIGPPTRLQLRGTILGSMILTGGLLTIHGIAVRHTFIILDIIIRMADITPITPDTITMADGDTEISEQTAVLLQQLIGSHQEVVMETDTNHNLRVQRPLPLGLVFPQVTQELHAINPLPQLNVL